VRAPRCGFVTPELEPDWQLLNDILSRGRECPSAADVLARLHAIEERQTAAAAVAVAAAAAVSEKRVAVAAAADKENQMTGKLAAETLPASLALQRRMGALLR
jgi:hypothetical protein